MSDRVKHAWIYDVIVAPAFRGRGIGHAVVKLALDHPAVRGAGRVHLATRDAHGLYRKLGFLEEAELPPRGYPSSTMHLLRTLHASPAPQPSLARATPALTAT
ncbi:MAG: GNAT family N-acetyltransferase [Polyangiaceae bacterium]